MRLKNKKTGRVETFVNIGLNNSVDHSDGTDDDVFFALKGDQFNSLAELNAEWEDAPEEIKPFEEVAKVKYGVDLGVAGDPLHTIKVADIDYYEILPDGTKKTEFNWDEAMQIEKKTHGKWRVPTQAEWYAIVAAFGAGKDNCVTGEALAKNLDLTTDAEGFGAVWSSTVIGDTYAYYLSFYGTNLYPQSYNNKVGGFTVRCIAR